MEPPVFKANNFFMKTSKLPFLTSAIRLGGFWKFLVTKFLSKEAQMSGNFLSYLDSISF